MKAKKPMKGAGLPTTPVTIKNSAGVGLLQLDAVVAGQQEPAKIAGPLESGKTVRAMVPHDKSCQVDLHGSFEDGSTLDASGVDVCKQKTINLTPP